MLYKYKFILFYIFLFTADLHAVISRAGYEYVTDEDAWLRLQNVPATWHDARLRCHLQGGALASPTTGAMTKAMTDKMAQYDFSLVFVGIHAVISKGDFMIMDKKERGVALDSLSMRWRRGDPNNVNNQQDCLVMDRKGELIDVPCTSVNHYFCRKEDAKMTLNVCGTTATGYHLESRTGSCYKFHLVPRPWQRAAMACHAEGGHLVVINSNTESKVLKEIFENNPTSSIKGGDPNMAHVGFWDWGEHGEWLTIFGETLPEAGFEGWSQGEPSNQGGEEFCGSIKRDGHLNDIACYRRLPFICEITPQQLDVDLK